MKPVVIKFKCRYRTANYFRVWDENSKEHELQVNDDGTMRRMFEDPIPQSWLDAYAALVAKEKADYAVWREEFERKYGYVPADF